MECSLSRHEDLSAISRTLMICQGDGRLGDSSSTVAHPIRRSPVPHEVCLCLLPFHTFLSDVTGLFAVVMATVAL